MHCIKYCSTSIQRSLSQVVKEMRLMGMCWLATTESFFQSTLPSYTHNIIGLIVPTWLFDYCQFYCWRLRHPIQIALLPATYSELLDSTELTSRQHWATSLYHIQHIPMQMWPQRFNVWWWCVCLHNHMLSWNKCGCGQLMKQYVNCDNIVQHVMQCNVSHFW